MSSSLCGRGFLFLKKTVSSGFVFAFVPSLCKAWSCSECRLWKAKIVRSWVKKNLSNRPLWLLTFTMYHSGGEEVAWSSISDAWNRFRTYVNHKYGKFSYLRVLEPHKEGGYPHMHVLVDKNIAHLDIVKKLRSWGFGWNFQSQPIDLQGSQNYVTKYLTKGWENVKADYLRQLTKSRIVSGSRDLPAIFTIDSQWTALQHTIPVEHATYYCSLIIHYCLEHKCKFVDSKPFFGGFMIHSDVEFDPNVLYKQLDPYIWNLCEAEDFHYLYGALQMELAF